MVGTARRPISPGFHYWNIPHVVNVHQSARRGGYVPAQEGVEGPLADEAETHALALG
jgi:hypothetical protein